MTTNAEAAFLNKLPREFLSKGVTMDEADLLVSGERIGNFHIATFEVAGKTLSDVDHHEVREIWYVLEGEAAVISRDVERDVRAGDYVYMDNRVPHQLRNDTERPLKVLSIWW